MGGKVGECGEMRGEELGEMFRNKGEEGMGSREKGVSTGERGKGC